MSSGEEENTSPSGRKKFPDTLSDTIPGMLDTSIHKILDKSF